MAADDVLNRTQQAAGSDEEADGAEGIAATAKRAARAVESSRLPELARLARPYGSLTAAAAARLMAPSTYDAETIEERCRLIGLRVKYAASGSMAVAYPAAGGTATRKLPKVNQGELARKAGITKATLRNVYAGKAESMTIPRLMAIAGALDLPAEYLTSGLGFSATGEDRLHAPRDLATEEFRDIWELAVTASMLDDPQRKRLLELARHPERLA